MRFLGAAQRLRARHMHYGLGRCTLSQPIYASSHHHPGRRWNWSGHRPTHKMNRPGREWDVFTALTAYIAPPCNNVCLLASRNAHSILMMCKIHICTQKHVRLAREPKPTFHSTQAIQLHYILFFRAYVCTACKVYLLYFDKSNIFGRVTLIWITCASETHNLHFFGWNKSRHWFIVYRLEVWKKIISKCIHYTMECMVLSVTIHD